MPRHRQDATVNIHGSTGYFICIDIVGHKPFCTKIALRLHPKRVLFSCGCRPLTCHLWAISESGLYTVNFKERCTNLTSVVSFFSAGTETTRWQDEYLLCDCVNLPDTLCVANDRYLCLSHSQRYRASWTDQNTSLLQDISLHIRRCTEMRRFTLQQQGEWTGQGHGLVRGREWMGKNCHRKE